MPDALTLPAFVARWQQSTLTERSAAQQHFLDLCHLLDHPTPAQDDPTGERFTFEKGVKKEGGGAGYADVWKRGFFAFEYKGKRKSLADAYQQLLQYRESLESPPLLVVCDLNRFEVHTNFTGTVKQVYAFTLADLLSPKKTPICSLPPLDVLRAVFFDPEKLRPEVTTEQITTTVAAEFGRIALNLQESGYEPPRIARFLIRLLFCLFAEDTGLLPAKLFTNLVAASRTTPADFQPRVRDLFAKMATGGFYGSEKILHFNGGLFADDDALPLTDFSLFRLQVAARTDWSSVEPSVFGTLFERSLDPAKRAKLGAHYTSRDDILTLIEPVLMAPLRRRWEEVRAQAESLLTMPEELRPLLQGFVDALRAVRVLDPACGSGNFLYVALRALLDLEKEAVAMAVAAGLTGFAPGVSPAQMRGLEVNEYAHELAPVTVWIGYLQWRRENGFPQDAEPILPTLETVRQQDALLAFDAGGQPVQAQWPEADVIVGNPPFLGGKRLRAELGDEFVGKLFRAYAGQVPAEADLVTYWFERARALVAAGQARRVGLLATNSIRGGASRKVLERIKESGDIFFAWADRPWILEGAAVRVSMVGFDGGQETERTLNGLPAEAIHPDLTGVLDLTAARRLPENAGLAFMGDTKGGAFDIPGDIAALMLTASGNPNGRPNRDVVRPWVNGLDIVRRPRGMWIIDFGTSMSEEDAALYEMPFEYVMRTVKPEREKNNRAAYRDRWWIHMETRPALRSAVEHLPRFIGTPAVAKHRVFTWLKHPTLADHALFAFARSDDYFFGVLHSLPHELWALRMGTSLEDRPRYTPTTTFETFPLPWSPGQEPQGDPKVTAIAEAARRLVELRDNWLNPASATAADRNRRTLTNLYNLRPTWLANAHAALDAAVFAAYDWPADITDAEILERLLALNKERAG